MNSRKQKTNNSRNGKICKILEKNKFWHSCYKGQIFKDCQTVLKSVLITAQL